MQFVPKNIGYLSPGNPAISIYSRPLAFRLSLTKGLALSLLKNKKPPRVIQTPLTGTFREFLLMASSRRLGVRLRGSLASRMGLHLSGKYSYPYGQSREKLSMEIAWPKLKICL